MSGQRGINCGKILGATENQIQYLILLIVTARIHEKADEIEV